jgi:casein kinase 1
MAKQYRDPKSKVHIPYRKNVDSCGTVRYISVNTHRGREQSRRDDLESLGYMLIYFARGRLPWQGFADTLNKFNRIGRKKRFVSIKKLCRGLPEEFREYLTFTRALKFKEQPDYDHLRGLFTNGMLSFLIRFSYEKARSSRRRRV